jgi:hypothetical protein
MLDRIAKRILRIGAAAQEGSGTRFDPERPVRSGGLCLAGQAIQGLLRQVRSSGSGSRLDQLAQAPVLGYNLLVFAGGARSAERLFVSAQAVTEYGAGVLADGNADSLAAGANLTHGQLDQFSGFTLLPAPCVQDQRTVRRRSDSGRLLY